MKFNESGVFEISKEELVQSFSLAFASTIERDAFLFQVSKPQERTFMHRFAQELRKIFALAENFSIKGKPVLSLDVEYNRDGIDCKRRRIGNCQEKGKWIAPDIILHERGSGRDGTFRNDIFACEMKKSGDARSEDANRLKHDFLGRRKYQYGIDFYAFSKRDPRVRGYAFDLYVRGCVESEKYVFDENSGQFLKQ